jgi:AraC family transcriptional regulator of adaptative response/methylated-DNA-[protein]-cysteine methyltransferase
MALAMTTPAPALNEDACWEAVEQRRKTSDGLFFVAVTSTKIYCRPSCPSRTPMRKNIRFFRTPDECEAAGFRACRRCKPRDPVRGDVALVKAISRRLNASDEPPTLADLSAEFGVSQFHLQRTFKRITGVSPRQYAAGRRAERLRDGLRNGNGVATAAYSAGFGSSSRLYEAAPALLGMTPARYGRGGAGMRIAYTITTCTYGRMIVGATEHGISSLGFGDRDAPMIEALHREYPHAAIERDDAGMRRRIDDVLRAVEDGTGHHQLPLDIRATAFKLRVWDALRKIPRGQTRSYSDIARAIGAPKAARAVGNACANNPVAVLIPCHRVIKEDGSLGNYGYGVERKTKLLEREGAL